VPTSPPNLLAAATERAKAEGLDIDYRLGDAEQLPFEDGAFDAVVSTCGVMFASRPEAAAAELARVCRKGGRVALTTWLSDSNLFKMFQVMKPYMPPPRRARRRRRPSSGAGGADQGTPVRRVRLKLEKGVSYYREPSGEAAWNTFSTGYGPTKSLAGSLDEARRADSGATSSPSTTASRPNSASACRASTG
jgi:SAM-dependent methyltransferase